MPSRIIPLALALSLSGHVSAQINMVDLDTVEAYAPYRVLDPDAMWAFTRLGDDSNTFQSEAKLDLGIAQEYFEEGTFQTSGALSCLDTLYDSYQSTLAGVSLEDYTSYAFGNSFKDFYDTDYPWYDFINTTLEGRGGDSANKQSVALRTVNVRKGAVGLMMLHALDTLDNAIAMDNECSKYEWDKGWSYLYGEADNSPTPGKNAPFVVAFKRDNDFKASGGLEASVYLPNLFRQGQKALASEPRDLASAQEASDAIKRMMTTTFVRAAIKYSKKIIGTDEYGYYEYSATYHGEGYTYWRAVSAWVATFDDTNAKIIEGLLISSRDPDDFLATATANDEYYDHCAVRAALESMYEALGIDCDMVGTWKDEVAYIEENGHGFCPDQPTCAEGTQTIATADAIPTGVEDDTTGINPVCGAGEYFNNIECKLCPPGYYQPDTDTPNAQCISCPGGYYCPVEGTGGEEAPGPTGISLLKCPMHMYAPQPKDTGDQIEPGAVQCTPCMEGSRTLGIGMMMCDALLCDEYPEYYLTANETFPVESTSAKEGTGGCVCMDTFVLSDDTKKATTPWDRSNTEYQVCTCDVGFAINPDIDPFKCTPCLKGVEGVARIKNIQGTDPALCELQAEETDTTSIMMIVFIVVALLVPMLLLYAYKSGSIAEEFFSSFALEAIMSVSFIAMDCVDIVTDIYTFSYVTQLPVLKQYHTPYTLLAILATVGGTAALGFKLYVLKAAYADAHVSNTAYQVAPEPGNGKDQEMKRASSFSATEVGSELLLSKKKQLAMLHREVVTAVAGIISFLVEDGPLAVLNINILYFLLTQVEDFPPTINDEVRGTSVNQLIRTICTSLFINLIGFGVKVALFPWLKTLYTNRKRLQADIDAITGDPTSKGAPQNPQDVGPSPMRVLAA